MTYSGADREASNPPIITAVVNVKRNRIDRYF